MLGAVALLLTTAGCEPDQPAAQAPTNPPPATSVTLRVAVAEDAALAEAIKRLRGEWTERSGGQLVVEAWTANEVLGRPAAQGAAKGAADLLIFPSRHLGELSQTGRLRPMRKSVLNDEDLRASDFFPLVRERLIVFGGETMALPIGCVTRVLVSRHAEQPLPQAALTWRDFFPDWRVTPPNNTPHAFALLERAACYASHTSRTALLFDPETMTPRLTEQAFLRSGELLQRKTPGAEVPIGVPTLAANRPAVMGPKRAQGTLRVPEGGRVSPLPGTDEVYNPIAEQWERVVGEPRHVPLLATRGRLLGVSTDTRNAASAFRFAAWLAGVQNARQLSTTSPNVANVRKSLARVADDWTGHDDRELGKQFAAVQAESLSSRYAFIVPRIIRIDDYLQILDRQIRDLSLNAATPQQALAATAAAWEKLTDEIGRDRQRKCYQAHLATLGG